MNLEPKITFDFTFSDEENIYLSKWSKLCPRLELVINEKYAYDIVDITVHPLDQDDGNQDSSLSRKRDCWSVKIENREKNSWTEFIDINLIINNQLVALKINAVQSERDKKIISGPKTLMTYFRKTYYVNFDSLDCKEINSSENFKIHKKEIYTNQEYILIPRYTKQFKLITGITFKRAFSFFRIVRRDLIEQIITKDNDERHIIVLSLLGRNQLDLVTKFEISEGIKKKWTICFNEGSQMSEREVFSLMTNDYKALTREDQCKIYGNWCSKYSSNGKI